MKAEQVQRWIGEQVEFLDHTKPYKNEVATLDSDNFPLYATLENLFDNGDCRISFKGKNGELEQVYIDCKHIAPKYKYPKAVRDELAGLRRDFEILFFSGGEDLYLLKWEECSDGVGDYQVNWENPFFTNSKPEENEAISNKKDRVNELFQFYVAGAIQILPVFNLKKEMERKIFQASQKNDELLEHLVSLPTIKDRIRLLAHHLPVRTKLTVKFTPEEKKKLLADFSSNSSNDGLGTPHIFSRESVYHEHLALNATKWEGVTWGWDLADKDTTDYTKKSQD